MIKIFTLNVGEEILNSLKDFEIHSYYDNFSISIAYIFEDDKLLAKVSFPNYDRINANILKFRG